MDNLTSFTNPNTFETGTIKWDEYDPVHIEYESNREITNIECPKCGKRLYRRTDIIKPSYPPKSQYECECGFIGYK